MTLTRIQLKLSLLAVIVLPTLLIFTLAAHADQAFYVTDKSARPGMVVSLSKNPSVVEPATPDNTASLLGVLGDSSAGLESQPGQITVHTEGASSTLVSTLTGDIEVGDHLTASSLSGFGSKLTGSGWIIGTAQASFNAQSAGALKSTITDAGGAKHDVYVGSIPVIIKVMFYSAVPSDKSILPKNLQQVVDSIAGRHASQVAILLGFLLLIAGLIISGLIVSVTVKNAMQATARQPLAKGIILQRMVQSCAIALCILVGAVGGAFVIIHLF